MSYHQIQLELDRHFENDQRWKMLFTDDNQLIEFKVKQVAIRPGGPFQHPLLNFYSDFHHQFFNKRNDEIFISENALSPVLNDLGILEIFTRASNHDYFPRFLKAGAHRYYHLNPANVSVGILTAGGTAPGLNIVIDSIVKRHFQLGTKYAISNNIDRNLRILGIIGGFAGLLNKDFIEIDYLETDKHALEPCSFLKALRTEKTPDIIDKLSQVLEDSKLDILYTIGGNGTQLTAHRIYEQLQDTENPPIIVAGPKTMDNDLNFTDVTFGFRTTVDNAKDVIMRIHADAQALNRLAIIELFGAESGFISLHASYASGEVDYVLIPEVMENPAEEIERCAKRIAERIDKNQHAVLVVAEGASWILTDKKGSQAFQDLIKIIQNRLLDASKELELKNRPEIGKKAGDPVLPSGFSIFSNEPRHQIRSTPPNTFDIDLCKYTGKLMVDTALAGYTDCSVNVWQNEFVLVPLATTTAKLKRVNIASYYFLTMMEKYLLP